MAAFVAVVDQNGFAPAARRLGVSPSAVTRLIAGLEQHLGIALLRRTTRAMTLTDAGARYLERSRRILADIEDAESVAQAERRAPSGRLVVTAPVTFGHLHVGPLMAAYLRQYTEVAGELMLSDRVVNLVEEGVDVAVRVGPLDDSRLVARRVGTTRRIVVAAPDYLARRGVPASTSDLSAHDTITFADPAWRFIVDGTERRVIVASRFTTNDAQSAIGAALEGAGLAMVLAYQAADALRDGRLRIVLDAFERPSLPIQLVSPGSRLVSPKVRAFADLAIATMRWEFESFPLI